MVIFIFNSRYFRTMTSVTSSKYTFHVIGSCCSNTLLFVIFRLIFLPAHRLTNLSRLQSNTKLEKNSHPPPLQISATSKYKYRIQSKYLMAIILLKPTHLCHHIFQTLLLSANLTTMLVMTSIIIKKKTNSL